MGRILLSLLALMGGCLTFGASPSSLPAPGDLPLSSMMDLKFVQGLMGSAKVAGAEEKIHTVTFRIPRLVEGGASVPITVEMEHPMEADHYIKRLIILDEKSLVKIKCIANFTPQNGRAFIAASLRLAENTELKAIAECSKHGSWLSVSPAVKVGQGGCGSSSGAPTRKLWGNVMWVKFAKDSARATRINLAIRHPMDSGRTLDRAGKITQVYPEFYVQRLRVYYENQLVTELELSPGLSNNPMVEFALQADRGKTLRLEAINNDGQKFESSVSVQPL